MQEVVQEPWRGGEKRLQCETLSPDTPAVAFSSESPADIKASPLPPAPSVIFDRLTNVDNLLHRLLVDMDHFFKL